MMSVMKKSGAVSGKTAKKTVKPTTVMNKSGVATREQPKIFSFLVSKIYSLYVAKAVNKKRTKQEVNEVISWMTGFDQKKLESYITGKDTLAGFFAKVKSSSNPKRKLINRNNHSSEILK